MPKRTFVFIGSSAKANEPALRVYELDTQAGRLTPLGVAPPIANPSYLAISPNGRFLYCVCDAAIAGGAPQGAVAAFAIDPATFALTLINQQPANGSGPCHLSLTASGRTLLIANYGSGGVASYPIKADGSIAPGGSVIQHHGSSVNTSRQEGPHAHSIYPDPSGRFALAIDLGLDQVLVYQLDDRGGAIAPAGVPFTAVTPGSGPRHMAFDPSGNHAYLINELDNTIGAYAYDAGSGALKHLQTVPTLPAGWSQTSYPSDIHVSPNGRFLYGSNRGHESIAIFAIDGARGTLTPLGHELTRGKWPRVFGVSPRGDFMVVANQHTNNVVVFRMDAESGMLKATGHVIETPSPCCVKFLEV